MKFLFDLDGTLTTAETLPRIAKAFGLEDAIDSLTQRTLRGDAPFVESFIERVDLLGRLDVDAVSLLLSSTPTDPHLASFIRDNLDNCAIVTGNFRGWIDRLADQFGCRLYASEGNIDLTGGVRLTRILSKQDIVSLYQDQGEQVVFIGDSHNDAEAMRLADISIACGTIHQPTASVLEAADYIIYDSKALVRLLGQIQEPKDGLSVVISAAGTGSRLGIGQTKALVSLYGRPLIHHQLEQLSALEDVRIVVGYQAQSLMQTVLEYRRDVIFVCNHDYFTTKTGASLYLGSRHAHSFVFALDGDCVVHPQDLLECIRDNSEFLGITRNTSSESVFAIVNEERQVVAFSQDCSDYEWSGPALIRRDRIRDTKGHLYQMLEAHLPMPARVVRACDIDTYDDYVNALTLIASWSNGNRKIDAYYSHLSRQCDTPLATRNKSPNFTAFDVAFVSRFAGKSKSLLECGAGTGLLVNSLIGKFDSITAVEKYEGFIQYISNDPRIHIIHADLLSVPLSGVFDVITLFGIAQFFSPEEALHIYRKCANCLHPSGVLIVKQQMGICEDLIIDGWSEELNTHYYSEYRSIASETALLHRAGLSVETTVDIYPDEYNRWANTRFIALVCKHADAYSS
jgi:HAD superfamily phosphoserine phosphatase-like hydrolase